jgi:hypothetical protein
MHLRPIVSGVVLLGVLLVGIVGVSWAVGASYADAPEVDQTVTNESLTADPGTWQATDATGSAWTVYDNETVYDSGGAELVEGTDYEWSTTNASVKFLSSGSVTSGESVTISYAYTTKTRDARALKGVFALPIRYAMPFAILIVAGMSVAGLAYAILRQTGGGPPTRNFGRG